MLVYLLSFGLGSEDDHIPTSWLLLYDFRNFNRDLPRPPVWEATSPPASLAQVQRLAGFFAVVGNSLAESHMDLFSG